MASCTQTVLVFPSQIQPQSHITFCTGDFLLEQLQQGWVSDAPWDVWAAVNNTAICLSAAKAAAFLTSDITPPAVAAIVKSTQALQQPCPGPTGHSGTRMHP